MKRISILPLTIGLALAVSPLTAWAQDEVAEEVTPAVIEDVVVSDIEMTDNNLPVVDPAVEGDAEPGAAGAEYGEPLEESQDATDGQAEGDQDSQVAGTADATEPVLDDMTLSSQAEQSPVQNNSAVRIESTTRNYGLAASSGSNGEAVALADNKALLGEYWRAVQGEDGSYTFANLKGGWLSVSGGVKSGASVAINSTTGLHWILDNNDDGSVSFAPQGYASLRMQLQSAASVGTKLLLATATGNANQRFFINLQEALTEAITNGDRDADGVVTLESVSRDGKVMEVRKSSKDNSANVGVYTANGGQHQKFLLESAGNGLYTIRSANSGKMVEVSGGSTKDGANVIQYSRNGRLHQLWYLVKCANGYSVRNAKSGLALNVLGADQGGNIQLASVNESDSQLLKITHVDLLDNGKVFRVSPSYAQRMYLGVAKNSAASNANVQLAKPGDLLGLYWRVKTNADGSFSLYNIKGNKALAADGGMASGKNALVASGSGSAWVASVNDDGTITLKLRDMKTIALDVRRGLSSEGANVWLYKANGGKAQKYVFVPNTPLTAAVAAGKPFDTSIYSIGSISASGKMVDIKDGSKAQGANVQIMKSDGKAKQKFEFEYQGNGLYRIQAANSGKFLGVLNASASSGANVAAFSRNDILSQYWYIEKCGSGYSIKNAKSGLALDVQGNKKADGANIEVYTAKGTVNQQFAIKGALLVSNGTYVITSELALPLVLDIKDGSKANSANAQLNRSLGKASQQFVFTHLGNGIYKIINKASGKALDVKGGSTSNSANVAQYTYSGNDNQKWRIGVSDNGGITFQSVKSGKMLDAKGGVKKIGTNVQQYSANNAKSQGWVLKSGSWDFGAEVVKYAKTLLNGRYSYVSSGYFPSTGEYNCSGLTWWVYHTVGYDVSHNQGYHSYYCAEENLTDSTMWQTERAGNWKTNPNDLKPGDLVYFSPVGSKWYTGHVGIYVGKMNGAHTMIHAWPDPGVCYANIYTFSSKDKFVGGGLPL